MPKLYSNCAIGQNKHMTTAKMIKTFSISEILVFLPSLFLIPDIRYIRYIRYIIRCRTFFYPLHPLHNPLPNFPSAILSIRLK